MTEASLAQIGGKGVFTKEIEDALLDRRRSGSSSLKDLPTVLPEGCASPRSPNAKTSATR